MKLEAKQRLQASRTLVAAKITPTQKAALMKKGFYIEDMGEEDDEFEGMYRWMNKKTDDFGEMYESEEEAWADCLEMNS